jgi:hypothetical protein
MIKKSEREKMIFGSPCPDQSSRSPGRSSWLAMLVDVTHGGYAAGRRDVLYVPWRHWRGVSQLPRVD